MHTVFGMLACLLLARNVFTLCFDGVADGTRVTQAIGVSRPDQEEIDGAGLQTLQQVALGPHMLC